MIKKIVKELYIISKYFLKIHSKYICWHNSRNRNFLEYNILSRLKSEDIFFGFGSLVLTSTKKWKSHHTQNFEKKKLKIIIDGGTIFTFCVCTFQVDPSISIEKWKGSQLIIFYENKNRNLKFLYRLKKYIIQGHILLKICFE